MMLTVEEWTALRLSLQVAACATLAGLPLAVAAGYLLARGKIPGKWLVETVLNLPLVLPPVVVGYLLLVAFSPRGPLGAALLFCFGVKIVFTWLGAAVASAVMSFPLAVAPCVWPSRGSIRGWKWLPAAWGPAAGAPF